MSPSSRDRLRIGLCPDRVLLAAYTRGLRPALAKTETAAIDCSGETPWSATLNALPALIARAGLRRPEVTVVLSNHLVRYAILPWNAALRNDAAWQALARHRFESVHGSAAASWAVRLSRPSFRGARVAAAVDAELLERLERAILESGGTFESAQPYLMSAFNRVCRVIGRESCWLVVDEPGRLTLALMMGGSWHAVRSRRAEAAWPETLAETLERENALIGLDQPCAKVVLYTEHASDAALGNFELRDLTLPPGAALENRRHAMVLA